MQNVFGSGVVWGTPTTDATGAAIANPSPIQLGVLQDISCDMSFDTKMLYGGLQFPIAVGRGKGKIDLKSKFAQINGATLNSLYFGQSMTSAKLGDVNDTTGAVIPTTPYQLTPTVPSSGTWSQDLGVKDSNGLPMTRVASAPATGQYSVAAGVYTFAAADVGKTVFINFQYTATSTTAKKGTIINLPMGYAPVVRLDLYMPYQGKEFVLTFPQCISSKLGFSTKQDDFMIPEMDFQGFADPAGNVAYWGLSE